MTESSLAVGLALGNNSDSKEKVCINNGEKSRVETNRDSYKYKILSFSVATKMINKFLTVNRIDNKGKNVKYTKEELAEKLGITIEEFERLKSPSFYKSKGNKVTMALVSLYCDTKWAKEK